ELLHASALKFFQENRLLDSVEEQLRVDALAGAEDAVIALAEFQFSQRKNEEARATLGRLWRSGDAAAEEARRHALVAQHLKGHGELTAAVTEMEAAVRLTPESREALLVLCELRAVLAQPAEAKAAYLRAYSASRSDAERIEVDGKLFESIRSAAALPGEARAQGMSAAALVEGFIRDLMIEAVETKSPAGWLRVARWKAWNADKASAVTFAAKAADMEPKNPAPLEFLARHSASNGEGAYAIAYLHELIALNPPGRDSYLREIAQIELLRGDHADALEILAQLVKSNPGSADALADLALAQERADRTAEAAVTWRAVLSLAPAPRRSEVAVSLLRVLEKLGAHEEATELLLRGADSAGDERTRFAKLDELLLYCQRHGRLPWVRGIFETRRKAKADDYVAAIVLGRVLKLMGEKAAAFAMFADAALATPNDAAVLPELVREAEELRRLELAVRLQEQFVRASKVEHSDGWLRLAMLQQGSGDIEGAERTWTQAVAKFPRDPDVLRRAADFHVQWGERATAATLLGKIHALDPTDVRAASELGELQFAAGRPAEARMAFESVMKLTPAVTETMYPSEVGGPSWRWRAERNLRGTPAMSGGLISPTAGSAGGVKKAEGDAQLRLGALRRLAEIARSTGGAALQKWIADWTASSAVPVTEPVWALYFSGAHDAALSLVEKSAAAESADDTHRQAFIRMSFEGGSYARLGAWMTADDRSPGELRLFSMAFAEVLRLHPEAVSPAMMAGLFPEGARARLWPCAMELASARRFRDAVTLGRRVFEDHPSQRAEMGRELARWHLALGETDAARAVLAGACDDIGESPDSPVYSAMRDLYFLLPQDQRAAFVRERLRTADGGTVHGLLVRALLFALEGQDGEARAALSRLLERRPVAPAGQDEANSAPREWAFASSAASQLIEWNLRGLACYVLDVALADAALRTQQERQDVRPGAMRVESGGEVSSERPLLREALQRGRAQRDALAYLAGGMIERQGILAKFRGSADQGVWSRFAEALEAIGGREHAVAIWKMLWELDPQKPGALRAVLDASRTAGDVATDEAVRRRCIEERINPGNDSTPREFALELADLLEARGATREALAMMDGAVGRNPEELRLLMRRAQLLEKCGRTEEADPVWKAMIGNIGGSAPARLALASTLEQRGKFAEAIEVRNRTGASGDTALPELFCKNGQTDDALLALDRLSGSGAVQAAMAVAEVLGLKGEGMLARSVLLAAAAKTAEPRALMQVRAKLLTIPGSPPPQIFLTRMQKRMRETARAHPELAGAYCEFFDRYAKRFGIAEEWQRELLAADAGDSAAGLVRIRRACVDGDADVAWRICAAMLDRADISDVTIKALRDIASRAGRPDLQLMIAERAAARAWPSADVMLEWARLLAANGSRGRAAEVLAQHAWLAGFTGGAEALGRAWLAAGDTGKAREFVSLAMRQGAPSPAPSVLAAMA
ncbi:MAG: hypothetical protein ABIP20_07850, partial [Chthoniobacteraceae bacterium]